MEMDFTIGCYFFGCKDPGSPLVERLALIALQHGFEFKRTRDRDDDDPLLVRTESAVKELVGLHVVRLSRREGANGDRWRTAFPAYPADQSERIGGFEFFQLGPSSNRLSLRCAMESSDGPDDFVRNEELIRATALDLYPAARPDFGWIDNAHRNRSRSEEAEQLGLTSISWVNFWGPAYVEKYGRSVLMGVPGFRVEQLDDGGIVHQLCPRLTTNDEDETRALRESVVSYCAAHGLTVKCHAPYQADA